MNNYNNNNLNGVSVEKKIEEASYIVTNNNTNQSFKKNKNISSNFSVLFPKLSSLKRGHLGKNINKIKSGEFVLHQLYNQKKKYRILNSLRDKSISESQSQKHILSIEIESSIENDENENENNIHTKHIMTNEEETNLRNALQKHFVFRNITEELLNSVIDEFIFCTFNKGNIIYKEGDEGNFFYVISKGTIEAFEKGNFKKKYNPWDCFGELSLITQQKREETVICLENVEAFTFDGTSFRNAQKRINEQLLKERFDFLNKISIFESLDSISKYNVAQRQELKIFQQNEKIIKIGEIGDTLYIIKEGCVSVRIGEKEVRKLREYDYFGENAVLINTKRLMDIVALEKTVCYELSKDKLIEALGNNYIDVILFCFFKDCIQKSKNLKIIFGDSTLYELFKNFYICKYNENEKIYDENSEDLNKKNPKRIIFVIEGSIYKDDIVIAEKGKVIGEEFFKDIKQSILNDLKVYPDLLTLEADITTLAQVMRIDLNKSKPLNLLNRLEKLRKLTLFKHLSEKLLESLASKLKKKKYNDNEVIILEDTITDCFYLISKGSVQLTKNGVYIRELESGSCFGENAIFYAESKRTTTVIAIGKVICYVLLKNDFDIILNDQKMKNYLLKKFALQDTSINLSDLHYVKFLGKGKFGSVSLVHNKKNLYAIKAISRKSVDIRKILANYFVNERRVMLTLDHPFIVKMVKSLKNNLYCFFLIEFVNGKNLSDYLSTRSNKHNIFETQFYIGSILLILEYMQKKFIVHRDIKPDNIMIDSNGYLKMIDFGTAKVLKNYTSTIIGTPHYIAPEILQGKGYSLTCDFWSMGICMYEIFYGFYPFGSHARDVIEIYKEVMNKDITYPYENNNNYSSVNDLISCLLTKKVNKRNCNINSLKQMSFFENFDFDKLNDFCIDPPYKPITSDMNGYLSNECPFINMVSYDSTSNNSTPQKPKKEHIPSNYNKNWADEF